jgi:energy-coupling factor transport system permease protein
VTAAGRAGLSPADVALLERLAPPAPTVYHRLNPLTKAVVATVATLVTLGLGGYLLPAILFGTLVVPGALVAGELRRVVAGSVVITLPLGVAVGLVSLFTRPGATVLFELGPFNATLEGLDFALRVVVRLFVMASALALFGLTTPARSFVIDLERRGVSPRLAFAFGSVIGAAPALVEQARSVRDAQRARAFDTEGRLRARLRAVVPLVGPVVLGALHDVEARSLALEARAFGRAGPRHLLWAPPDSARERAVRWALVAGAALLAIGSISGVIPPLP